VSSQELGKLIVGGGVVLVLLGLLVWTGALSWFGRLPGDLRVERPGFRLFVPWVSLLVVSGAINLVIWLARRLWR